MMRTKRPRRAHVTRRMRSEPKLRGDSQRERLMIGGAGPCNRFVFSTNAAKDYSVFRTQKLRPFPV